ncbi:MAG: YtxH domain-containing protein [Bryobacteraceae bacterium]|nr:YtxH domain-containing protein [Bryobacteraceae bacterium]
MDENNKISYFFLGLGLGVAAGLLFAPQSGEETRVMLKNKADEGRDLLKRRSEELRDQAAEAVQRGKETVSRHRENLASAMDAGKQAYRDALNADLAGEGV